MEKHRSGTRSEELEVVEKRVVRKVSGVKWSLVKAERREAEKLGWGQELGRSKPGKGE